MIAQDLQVRAGLDYQLGPIGVPNKLNVPDGLVLQFRRLRKVSIGLGFQEEMSLCAWVGNACK